MTYMDKLENDKNIDPTTRKMVEEVRQTITEKNDDYLLFITGTTGTGKSMLTLHMYEIFDPETCTINCVGLNPADHAKALKYSKNMPIGKRFCSYDEANVSKRKHQTKYNSDLLELYFQIRGQQMFHIWANPSVEITMTRQPTLIAPTTRRRARRVRRLHISSTARPASQASDE